MMIERNIRPERPPEKATDMELALFFVKHIDNPCETEVSPGVRENIRAFYLREAKKTLAGFTNENAKVLLEAKIREHEGDLG